MYLYSLEQLGAHVPGRVNSNRLKDRLLAQNTRAWRVYWRKRSEASDVGAALHFAQKHNYDIEAMHLAKAAMLVRKELLAQNQCFNGTFDTNCQRSAVPDLLRTLVNMILEGPGVMNKNE